MKIIKINSCSHCYFGTSTVKEDVVLCCIYEEFYAVKKDKPIAPFCKIDQVIISEVDDKDEQIKTNFL